MRKRLFFSLSMLLLSGAVLFSCSDDDNDTEKPKIEILTPQGGTQFQRGTTINVTAIISDNEAIASYKVNVHYAGDGHQHSKLLRDSSEDPKFHYDKSFTDAEGKKNHLVDVNIDIIADALPSDYHLGVLCFDKEGNESHQYISIKIVE